MISWKDIYSFDNDDVLMEMKSDHPTQIYEQLFYVCFGMEVLNEKYLYIIPEELLSSITFGKNIGAIILKKELNNEQTTFCEISNCMVCQFDKFEKIYNNINKSFIRQDFIRSVQEGLLDITQRNRGITEMTRYLAEKIERPVVILDNTYRFLTNSDESQLNDLVAEDAQSSYGLTLKTLHDLREIGILDEVIKSKNAEKYTIENFSVYAIPIFINGIKVATIAFPESIGENEYVIPIEYLYELPAIARIFSLELTKIYDYRDNKSECFPYLFSLIIDSEFTDIAYIKNRLSFFHYDLRENMYLILVERIEEDISNEFSVLSENLRKVFTNSIYMNRDKKILLLISRTDNDLISQFELEMWNSYLSALNLYAGMTGPFRGFDGFKRVHLKEVELTLKAGKQNANNKNLFMFDDYQIDSMLLEFPNQHDLSMYCFKPLMKLMEYDEKRNTELTKTLKVYIRNTKNTEEVYNVLHIHKNTLYQRLNKIKEIMNVDLSDADIIMRVQLTFYILNIQGRL
ncbi:MAG: PucR family transcriptional regulator [Lachnospirales bacterium]